MDKERATVWGLERSSTKSIHILRACTAALLDACKHGVSRITLIPSSRFSGGAFVCIVRFMVSLSLPAQPYLNCLTYSTCF